MDPTALIILLIVGLTLFIFLIRYLINRGVTKVADSIHNARVRKENAEKESVYDSPSASTGTKSSAENKSTPDSLKAGEIYLRDWYPDYKPAQIRHRRAQTAETKPAVLPASPQVKEPTAATVRSSAASVEQVPVSRNDRCCLCGEALGSRFAVLFVSDDGTEYKADRKCFDALDTLGSSEDRDAVQRARRYVSEQKRLTRDSALNAYLEKYLTSADEFLSQNN